MGFLGADAFARLAVELHQAPGVVETVGSVVSDPIVDKLYQLQIDTGEGPMLAALTGQISVHVPIVTAETRWPVWRDEALAAGIGSVLHLPLCTTGQPVGVLSLHQTAPNGFSADDEAIAQILARHACIAVTTARNDESMSQAVDARKLPG